MDAPSLPLPPGTRLGPGDDLGGSVRSRVSRHEVLAGPSDWGSSVVVKHFVPQPVGSRAGHGFEREQLGLTHLPGTPRVLASDPATRTLVLKDVGPHPTLADLLLGDDPDAACTATLDWAAALGRTLVSDHDVVQAARHTLGPALAEDRADRERLPRAGLARLVEVTGASRYAAAADSEVRDAVERLERDTPRHVLGPGDSCPDNAFVTPAGVRLVDLEGAGVAHVAYAAAYCAEPFSTCWCVFTPPSGLTGSMLSAFTTGAAAHLEGLADDPAWPGQVRTAVALWVLAGSQWLMDGALADRGMAPPGRTGPRFRALLLARWRWVVRECQQDLPDVAALCDDAITWASRAWREGSSLELPGYPAFRG